MSRELLFLLFFTFTDANADSVTESFSSIDQFDTTSTAVWNLAHGVAHVPFISTADSIDEDLDIGIGSDGVFDSTTYASFDINDGVDATLVTLDTSHIYQFTTFRIDSGVTVVGSGTSPLRIRVQGNATIAGTLSLNGANGTSLATDTSQNPQGGSGGSGGADGGQGGSQSAAATSGESVDTGKVGGGGFGADGAGGGGGSFLSAGVAGGGAGGGATGGSNGDDRLAELIGGGGGGGGGKWTAGGAAQNASGGGGGGGGGALLFFVGGNLLINSGGIIRANGGNGGGTSEGARLAGGGGGGAGGALYIAAGGTFVNNGCMHAKAGSGGTGSGCGAGGTGGLGQTRFMCSDLVGWTSGAGSNEDPLPSIFDIGFTSFTPTSKVILSKSYDTQNSSPVYSAAEMVTTLPAGTTATLELKGSSDNFVEDETDFVSSSDLSALLGKRYFKFRLTLRTTDSTVSPLVDSVSVTFAPHTQTAFQFGLAGCAEGASSTNSDGGGWGVMVILSMLASGFLSRFRKPS